MTDSCIARGAVASTKYKILEVWRPGETRRENKFIGTKPVSTNHGRFINIYDHNRHLIRETESQFSRHM